MNENAATPMSADELKAWRKARRADLVGRRAGTPQETRGEWNERITAALVAAFDIPHEAVVGFCWPFKGEFDARFAVRRWREHGALAALPEVVANRQPLQFRAWRPGVPMRKGVYDIPFPHGTEIVVPDVAVVPMNGFDARGFRLGYGGGFFDRTLAAHDRRIVAIGVAYEMLRLETIHPQPYDVPMDFVVTEAAIYTGGGEPLEAVDEAEARKRFGRLMLARRLPRSAYPEGGLSSPVCYADQFPGYFGETPDSKT
jgi:5,10-methenyltetrahydrofolate synthetase